MNLNHPQELQLFISRFPARASPSQTTTGSKSIHLFVSKLIGGWRYVCGMYVYGEHECKTFTIWCVYVYTNIIIHGTTKVVPKSVRLEKFGHWYFFRVFLFNIPAFLHFSLYLSDTRCLKSTFHPQLFPFWPVVDIFPSTHDHTPKSYRLCLFKFHFTFTCSIGGFLKSIFCIWSFHCL